MGKSSIFKKMLHESGLIIMPGAYDALSARIVELAGFKAILHTGYGTAASLLGMPDIGLVSFWEMVERVKSIAQAVNIPVIGDANTGYGNPINVYRTVKEYIKAGAAGLFIEDQVWPKRCGHMFGKLIIDKEEMIGKVMSAVDAKNEEDPDFVIGARTDAIAVTGIDDAIERVRAYREAGADFVFIEGFEDLNQMKRAVKEVNGPLMLNLVEGGRTPLISVKEVEDLGFKIVVFPVTTLYAACKGMIDTIAILRERGDARLYLDKVITFQEFAKIVRIDKFRAMEEKYIPKRILKKMYKSKKDYYETL